MATILIISQEASTRHAVFNALYTEHTLIFADSVERAVQDHVRGDLVIVDIGDGLQMPCQKLRALPAFGNLPMLCLLAGGDLVHALESGSDDCLRVPFVPRVLAARVRALLRRAPQQRRAPLVLEVTSKTAHLNGEKIDLTPTEFDLLDMLCQNQGMYMSATDLLVMVWNYPPGDGDPALVRNHIRNLRRKIENDPDRPRIVTSAHGRGYIVSVDFHRE